MRSGSRVYRKTSYPIARLEGRAIFFRGGNLGRSFISTSNGTGNNLNTANIIDNEGVSSFLAFFHAIHTDPILSPTFTASGSRIIGAPPLSSPEVLAMRTGIAYAPPAISIATLAKGAFNYNATEFSKIRSFCFFTLAGAFVASSGTVTAARENSKNVNIPAAVVAGDFVYISVMTRHAVGYCVGAGSAIYTDIMYSPELLTNQYLSVFEKQVTAGDIAQGFFTIGR